MVFASVESVIQKLREDLGRKKTSTSIYTVDYVKPFYILSASGAIWGLIMEKIMNVIKWLWQLPQNLLGFLLTRKYRCKSVRYMNGKPINTYYKSFFRSGISLGDYIILDYWYYGRGYFQQIVAHEYGHSRQSLILGWLYLPLVGLPSLIGNIWDRLFHKKWSSDQREKWYYSRYPENWADKLGGVVRD